MNCENPLKMDKIRFYVDKYITKEEFGWFHEFYQLDGGNCDAERFTPFLKLYNFAKYGPSGYEIPSDILYRFYCAILNDNIFNVKKQFLPLQHPKRNNGLNCFFIKIPQCRYECCQTLDLLYTITDDPYTMGKIACINGLSSLHSIGISQKTNVTILFGKSSCMTEAQHDYLKSAFIKGFMDIECGTSIKGCIDFVAKPFCAYNTVGSIISTRPLPLQCIEPYKARVGDAIILTKPLGTQFALHVYSLKDNVTVWSAWRHCLSEKIITLFYETALYYMLLPNKIASVLMHKYDAHAGIALNGYSIMEQATKLCQLQVKKLKFIITKLPFLENLEYISNICNNPFGVLEGKDIEIAGGLLICLPQEKAEEFLKDFKNQANYDAWIVGKVVAGNREANLQISE